jgi:hypothetical protein
MISHMFRVTENFRCLLLAFNFFLKMYLDSVEPNPSTERYSYNSLSWEELEMLKDPESLFEQGYRTFFGIRCPRSEAEGRKLLLQSAMLSHPVALAMCLTMDQDTEQLSARSFALYRESAERGHIAGKKRRRAFSLIG